MKSSNPYRLDPESGTCMSCGAEIVQPSRGRRRLYCGEDRCRRMGSLSAALATSWDEGWDAATRARGGGAVTTDFSAGQAAGYEAGFVAGRRRDQELVGKLIAVVRRHLRSCDTEAGAAPIEQAIRRVNDRYDIDRYG